MSAEEEYTMKSLHEHVLLRPDTYVGSIKPEQENHWVVEKGSEVKVVSKLILYNQGFIKIFDEIFVNAIDRTVVDKNCDTIKVDIDVKSGQISIFNNGKGVSVVKSQKYDIYNPELVFGNLLTSSNYNDKKKRIIGGLNGMGAKLCNIFSKLFVIETVDSERSLKYTQVFTDNMFKIQKPSIKKSNVADYTRITFLPDYARFGIKGLTEDLLSVLYRRVYDAVACTDAKVKVYLNGEKIPQNNFSKYISLYDGYDKVIAYNKEDTDNKIWEYAVTTGPLLCSFTQISFVNGINTIKGGTHVKVILSQITDKVIKELKTKKNFKNVTPAMIKEKLCIFVRATVVNPSFSSQSKEELKTPTSELGVKISVPEPFIKKVLKSSIISEIIDEINYKNQKELKKTTGTSSKKNILAIDKLEDANNAGSKRGPGSTLILVEGDSAKSFAMNGLSIIGRDNFGVFPLRGKFLNVREATHSQLINNAEVNNIKTIMGLEHGKVYTKDNIRSLRYSKVLILTDQDLDGIHIRCLLVNFIHYYWPELLEIDGFISTLKTPIIKLTKGKVIHEFYTQQDYNEFKEKHPEIFRGSYSVKYYKGLGTSNDKEAKDIFNRINKNTVEYYSETPKITTESLALAFEKNKADNRKDWIRQYDYTKIYDQSVQELGYDSLINEELIHYSTYNVMRSIPSLVDGLKPSQRKIIHTLFKRNYRKEIKVAQLAPAVAEETNYHHGETSLAETIVKLAQNFTGSNNYNLLSPNGEFGGRLNRKSASPRYIFTELNELAHDIFIKDDQNILELQVEEGQEIEPRFFYTVLPLVLLNGVQGIGTGFSSNIPCFNLEDVAKNAELYITKKQMKRLIPWYKGFTGKITPKDDKSYLMRGVYAIKGNTIEITEIPIDHTFEAYKSKLIELMDKVPGIVDIKNNSTNNRPHFTVVFDNVTSLNGYIRDNDPYKSLKLEQTIHTSNMYLFNEKGIVTKYDTPEIILRDFLKTRLKANTLRKKYMLDSYNNLINVMENKMRFIESIINGTIDVYKKSKKTIEDILIKNKFDEINGGYSYLLDMAIHSFTQESMDALALNIKKNKGLYSTLKNKTEVELYMEDLTNLKKYYQ